MAKAEKEKKKKREGTDKKPKRDKVGKEKHQNKANTKDAAEFSLLADEKTVNPALSSLFASKPIQPTVVAKVSTKDIAKPAESGEPQSGNFDEIRGEQNGDRSTVEDEVEDHGDYFQNGDSSRSGKRKRKNDGEEIEDVYMRRLAREEAKDEEAAAEKRAKRRKTASKASDEAGSEDEVDEEEVVLEENDDQTGSADGEDESEKDANNATMSPPPLHETQQAVDSELSKANRTVFLGNVSTSAITSKSSRKALLNHLQSFFPKLSAPKSGESKHSVESLRFRSTPYATAVPKKAAYAKKEIMDATTKSTNAYAVYSSPLLAREATKRLNGTVVLDRHLRVDEVAHPAKVDNRRCVFVGNLGFVDDESNIQAANAEDGIEKRKPGKTPADIEEGLWRTFGKCGKVESVRVVRDTTTRVGKGIAYVQFDDGNAVEAALQYNDKKFPPMLPRKLRVSRAKAQKRNSKPGASAKPSDTSKTNGTGYRRKISGEEASRMGRVSKLYGRAAAGQMKQRSKDRPAQVRSEKLGERIKPPEVFVFEGQRASSKSGNAGLRLGRKGKKGTTNGARRGAAFKANKKKR